MFQVQRRQLDGGRNGHVLPSVVLAVSVVVAWAVFVIGLPQTCSGQQLQKGEQPGESSQATDRDRVATVALHQPISFTGPASRSAIIPDSDDLELVRSLLSSARDEEIEFAGFDRSQLKGSDPMTNMLVVQPDHDQFDLAQLVDDDSMLAPWTTERPGPRTNGRDVNDHGTWVWDEPNQRLTLAAMPAAAFTWTGATNSHALRKAGVGLGKSRISGKAPGTQKANSLASGFLFSAFCSLACLICFRRKPVSIPTNQRTTLAPQN